MDNDKSIRPGDLDQLGKNAPPNPPVNMIPFHFHRLSSQYVSRFFKNGEQKNIAMEFIETSLFQFWANFCETICLTHCDLFVLKVLFLEEYIYAVSPFPFI